jgi:hypothetical protein
MEGLKMIDATAAVPVDIQDHVLEQDGLATS